MPSSDSGLLHWCHTCGPSETGHVVIPEYDHTETRNSGEFTSHVPRSEWWWSIPLFRCTICGHEFCREHIHDHGHNP